MSHFTVLAIVGTVPLEQAEDRIAAMLAPYEENLEVAPYHEYRSAYAIGSDLRHAVPETVLERMGRPRPSNEGLEQEEHALWARRLPDGHPDAVDVDRRRRAWAMAADAYDVEVAAAFQPQEAADLINARDPDDDDRLFVDEGGVYRVSTRNPNAKWDWYEIGGRWTGSLRLKTPELVGAVGRPGLMTAPAPTGTADIAHVGEVDVSDLTTFAMLTPEGWEAPAEIGLFATEYGRTESDEAWARRVAESLAALDPRTVIAVVDCHI